MVASQTIKTRTLIVASASANCYAEKASFFSASRATIVMKNVFAGKVNSFVEKYTGSQNGIYSLMGFNARLKTSPIELNKSSP
jgi:hypothetical protein